MSGLLDELLEKDPEEQDQNKENKDKGKDYIQYGSDFSSFIGEK